YNKKRKRLVMDSRFCYGLSVVQSSQLTHTSCNTKRKHNCYWFESILEGLFGPGLLKDLSLFKGIQSLCLYLVLHF
uniref:Uncharacterized protein n=1 Tax=Dromaius novaehollandiae TaxID=8790 RepID=A0A8C4KCR8_DRONO